MNSRVIFHCAWAALVVVAYFAGSLKDVPGTVADSAETRFRSDASDSGGAAGDGGRDTFTTGRGGAARREDLASLPPEQIKARIFAALSEPIRWKRMLRVMELFEGMTAENRHAITDAFIRQTQKEGRTHHVEWELLKERAGEVGGREEVESSLAADGPNAIRHAGMNLKGWAAVDPVAAQAWFARQDQGMQKALGGAFLVGLARAQPKEAALFSLSLPDEVSGPASGPLAEQIFQSGGTQAAGDVLAALRAREDVPIARRRVISYHLGQKMRNAGAIVNDPARTLDWAAGHLGTSSMIGPGLLAELLKDAAARNADIPVRWMETHGTSLGQDQAEVAYRTLGAMLQVGSRNDLDQWLAKNPEHPYRDHVLSAAATNAYKQGKIAEVQKLNAAIQDPSKHVQLEKIQRELKTEGSGSGR